MAKRVWGRPSQQDTGGSDGRDHLAELLSACARDLQRETNPEDTLVEIVRSAIALVPGCDEGSVSMISRGRSMTSRAASGELPHAVDLLQGELKQGPCLDAIFEQETIRVSDMAHEERWPLFTARALAAGAFGMLSFQLFVQDDNLGALNLFSRTAGAFTDESEHVGRLFAVHASIAIAAAQEQAKLDRSVVTQQLIGQAQGVLMERYKVTDDQAFAMLVRASQSTNTKLRELAQRLVHSGEFTVSDAR